MAVALTTLALWACAPAAETKDVKWTRSGTATDTIDHHLWDQLLTRYVTAGADGINRVDYAALKREDSATLKKYLDAMQAVDIERYPKDEQFAYWVNLYNAATVNVIIDNYPVKSIRDIGVLGLGPWKEDILTVGGERLSLDDIEHGILRPIWKDVRIHYAVNCASLGCPNLANHAYTAANLEAMLDAAARGYINHPRGFRRVDGELVASSIYDWYGTDWGGESAVLDHARKYASPETKAMLASAQHIDRFDYNWSLNAK
ncbi:DUF547 domain-containing protein [Erythrobacter sp.]|uniref:DUF547 domain-containing protein n=1 Tax=Erythrobacter sp. TaxID=1042 RepID=UPI0031201F02